MPPGRPRRRQGDDAARAAHLARQAQSCRRMASPSSASPIRTSSVPRASVPQGSPNVSPVRAPARSRKPRRSSPGDVNETLRADQRGAEALRSPRAAARAAAAPDRRRSTTAAGRACARGDRRARTRGAPRTSSSQGTSAAVPSSPSGKLARSAAGLRRASSRCSATTASARREIQLRQQDPVGRLDLRARLLVPGQLAAARLRVDRRR